MLSEAIDRIVDVAMDFMAARLMLSLGNRKEERETERVNKAQV